MARASDDGEDAHRGLALAEILAGDAEAEDFGVGADDEEYAAEDGALNDGARDCFERIARFGAERGRAFKSNKAEEREHQSEAQAAAGHANEVKLDEIRIRGRGGSGRAR